MHKTPSGKTVEKTPDTTNPQSRHNERKQYEEVKVMNSIRDKLRKNKALIAKADKGNSIIIVYESEYEQKVLDFISHGGAEEVNSNITKKFQKDLRNTTNSCKSLIDTEKKGKLINLNPETLPWRGLIKVHKEGTPICPVVNFKNAPSYKLAKMLADILNSHLPMPNVYNVQNSTQLMNNISQIPIVPELKLASLDISNIYTNIPTKDLISIINTICKNHNIEDTVTQLSMSNKESRSTATPTVIRQQYLRGVHPLYINALERIFMVYV